MCYIYLPGSLEHVGCSFIMFFFEATLSVECHLESLLESESLDLRKREMILIEFGIGFVREGVRVALDPKVHVLDALHLRLVGLRGVDGQHRHVPLTVHTLLVPSRPRLRFAWKMVPLGYGDLSDAQTDIVILLFV